MLPKVRAAFGAGAIGVLVLAGCGDDGSTVGRADEALTKLRSGTIELRLTAAATGDGGTTDPVGFELAGAFDLDAGSTFPVLDLTYTKYLGSDELETRVRSDGQRLVMRTGGRDTEVPADRAGPLRKSQGGSAVSDLGIAGWVQDVVEDEGPTVDGTATRRISGRVDPVDLLSDLARLTALLGGEADVKALDGADAERVRSRLRSSTFELFVGGDDMPRQLRAHMDFGADVPVEVQAALGQLAAATMDVELRVSSPNQPVTAPQLG